MTALLTVTGVALLATAIVHPFSVLWVPGAVLVGCGWWLNGRPSRKARKRRLRRRGWIVRVR